MHEQQTAEAFSAANRRVKSREINNNKETAAVFPPFILTVLNCWFEKKTLYCFQGYSIYYKQGNVWQSNASLNLIHQLQSETTGACACAGLSFRNTCAGCLGSLHVQYMRVFSALKCQGHAELNIFQLHPKRFSLLSLPHVKVVNVKKNPVWTEIEEREGCSLPLHQDPSEKTQHRQSTGT